jgi:MoaA/NifB/PqqE/SkfB family radical SAM enzyme
MTLLRRWRGDARRRFKEVLRRGIRRPEQVLVELTDRCNYRCPSCSKWRRSPADDELTTAEWAAFLGRAARMTLASRVVFAGGEPLLREDLAALVACCAEQGCETVVITNGSLLDEKALHRLEDAGLTHLMVSLNSLDESAHDRSRGVEGSFAAIMELLRIHTSAPRTTVLGLATILMADNAGHVEDLVDLVDAQGLHGILLQACVGDALHRPSGDGRPEEPEAWSRVGPRMEVDPPALDALIDRLLTRQRKGSAILNPPSQLRAMKAYYRDPGRYAGIPCLAGVTSLMVAPRGDVRICFSLPPVANVRDAIDPRALWTSRSVRGARDAARRCPRPCRIMNHVY